MKQFFHSSIPEKYAILSHTWNGDEEVSYQEMKSPTPESRKKTGYLKIVGFCQKALGDNLEWAWIDTACIDKTSSHELQEAIGSMWRLVCTRAYPNVHSDMIEVTTPTQVNAMSISQICPVIIQNYSNRVWIQLVRDNLLIRKDSSPKAAGSSEVGAFRSSSLHAM
jgi:hypothetical protein